MSRFSEHPTAFPNRHTGSFELTAQEQATIFAAREILARHINRNPVLSSWQAVMDYCAFYAEAEIMPT
jgi:DNA repair protein RadC